jgi:hypothetical protein
MTPRRLSIPIGLALLFGGCASLPGPAASRAGTPVSGSYTCRASDGQAVPSAATLGVSVSQVPEGGPLTLRVGRGRSEVLQPLSESAGRVFAGTTYAWRGGAPASTLTDLATFITYQCRPAADRVAVR